MVQLKRICAVYVSAYDMDISLDPSALVSPAVGCKPTYHPAVGRARAALNLVACRSSHRGAFAPLPLPHTNAWLLCRFVFGV